MKSIETSSAIASTASCPASVDDHTRPLEIHRLEDLLVGSSLLSDPFVRKLRFEIIWIKKGNGSIRADRRRYAIHDKMIYCIAPGSNSNFLEKDNSFEGYYISFRREFIQPWQNGLESGPADFFEQPFNVLLVPVPENMEAELDVIVHSMRHEYVNSFHHKLELLRGLLSVFVIYFSRRIVREEETTVYNRENLIFKQFLHLVKKHFSSTRMVSDYARLLCITPNYLNRMVKKISGRTASYHIQQQIILEAKKQAVYCGANLKEIAYSLGFDNLAHFSKFFKINSGTSFSRFKKGIPDTARRPE